MLSAYRLYRGVTRGLGGPASGIITMAFIPLPDVVEQIKKKLGGSRGDDEFVFEDDVSIYKIAALLTEINRIPLNNPLFNKMSKLIVEKKIDIDVQLVDQNTRKSEPYRIVIGEHRIIRETDE